MRALIFGLVLATVSGPASAAGYYLLSVGASGDYVQLDTIKRDGDNATGWILIVENQSGVSDSKTYDMITVEMDYSCKSDQSRIPYMAGYTIGGQLAFSGTTGAVWAPVIPGTRDSTIEKVMCTDERDPSLVLTYADNMELAKAYRSARAAHPNAF
jgi:hypothetical protein